jgi:hypothetical protein
MEDETCLAVDRNRWIWVILLGLGCTVKYLWSASWGDSIVGQRWSCESRGWGRIGWSGPVGFVGGFPWITGSGPSGQ